MWNLELSLFSSGDTIKAFLGHDPMQILDQIILCCGGLSFDYRYLLYPWPAKPPLVDNHYIIITPYNLAQFYGLMLHLRIEKNSSFVTHR